MLGLICQVEPMKKKQAKPLKKVPTQKTPTLKRKKGGRRSGTVKDAQGINEFLYGAFNEPTKRGNDPAFILQETAFRLKLEAGELIPRSEERDGSIILRVIGSVVAKAILHQDVEFFTQLAKGVVQGRVDLKTGDWITCDPLRAELWQLKNNPQYQGKEWTLEQLIERLPKSLQRQDERTFRRACKQIGFVLKGARLGRPSK